MYIIRLLLFVVFILLTSCNRYKPNDSCRILCVSFDIKKNRDMYFIYKENKVSHIVTKVENSDTKKVFTYKYTNANQLAAIISTPILETTLYYYNKTRQLKKISTDDHIIQRIYNYNLVGNIKEEKIYFNKRLFQINNYSYNYANLPIKCNVYDKDGVHVKTMQFFYDSNTNPFINLGIIVNTTELLYGYPVGNAKHNLQKIVIIYQTPTKLPVDGKIKKTGNADTVLINYVYNKQGFPLVINNNQHIEYDCKNK